MCFPRLVTRGDLERAAMLIALVQGIIGSFDEKLSPLKQARREKAGNHAKDDFLRKSGVHADAIRARGMPVSLCLPKPPLPGFHDPKSKQEISYSVRQHTGRETFRSIGDKIVKHASKERCRPIGMAMREAKNDRYDGERHPRERSERDAIEVFINQEAKHESTPEDFLDQRYDDGKAEKPADHGRPVKRRLRREKIWIEPGRPCPKSKKRLRSNPKYKDDNCDRQAERQSRRSLKRVLGQK